jgi:hypothetical protein
MMMLCSGHVMPIDARDERKTQPFAGKEIVNKISAGHFTGAYKLCGYFY